jgi:hypothetical protein
MSDDDDPNAQEEDLGVRVGDADAPVIGGQPQIAALIRIMRPAEERTRKKGGAGTFVSANVLCLGAGKLPKYWSLIANSAEAQRALLSLAVGEIAIVYGGLSRDYWERQDGSSEEQMKVAVRRIRRIKMTEVDDQYQGSADRLTGDDGPQPYQDKAPF